MSNGHGNVFFFCPRQTLSNGKQAGEYISPACFQHKQQLLAVLLLEVLHEGHESIDTFHREGVVNGGADAANAAVALQ